MGWDARNQLGRKLGEESRLHSPHRKFSDHWPEISVEAFPLWITHESRRYTSWAGNPEKLSSLFPSSRQGVYTPSSSVSFSQRRAQGMNDQVLGTYACSKTHNHTVTKPPEPKAALHRQTKKASWNKLGQAEIDRKIEANPHTVIPPPTETSY